MCDFTKEELTLIGSALVMCDILSDTGKLPRPWCRGHTNAETTRILEKISTIMEEIPHELAQTLRLDVQK